MDISRKKPSGDERNQSMHSSPLPADPETCPGQAEGVASGEWQPVIARSNQFNSSGDQQVIPMGRANIECRAAATEFRRAKRSRGAAAGEPVAADSDELVYDQA